VTRYICLQDLWISAVSIAFYLGEFGQSKLRRSVNVYVVVILRPVKSPLISDTGRHMNREPYRPR